MESPLMAPRPISSASTASLSSSSSTSEDYDELREGGMITDLPICPPKPDDPDDPAFQARLISFGELRVARGLSQDIAGTYAENAELDIHAKEEEDYFPSFSNMPYETAGQYLPSENKFAYYDEEEEEEDEEEEEEEEEEGLEENDEDEEQGTFPTPPERLMNFSEDEQGYMPPISHLYTHVMFLTRQNDFLRMELSHSRENTQGMRRIIEMMEADRIAEHERWIRRVEAERNEWIAELVNYDHICSQCKQRSPHRSPSLTPRKPRYNVSSTDKWVKQSTSPLASPTSSPLSKSSLDSPSSLTSSSSNDGSKTLGELLTCSNDSRPDMGYLGGGSAEVDVADSSTREHFWHYKEYEIPAVPFNSDSEDGDEHKSNPAILGGATRSSTVSVAEVEEEDNGDVSSVDLDEHMLRGGGLLAKLLSRSYTDNELERQVSNDSIESLDKHRPSIFMSMPSTEDVKIRLVSCNHEIDAREDDVVIFPKKVFSFSTWGGEGDGVYGGSSDEGESEGEDVENLEDEKEIDIDDQTQTDTTCYFDCKQDLSGIFGEMDSSLEVY